MGHVLWFKRGPEGRLIEINREQPRLSHQMTPEAIARAKAAPPIRVAKPKPSITHRVRLNMTPGDLRIILDKMKRVQETMTPGDNGRAYTWYEPGLEVEFIYRAKEVAK